MLLRRPRPAEDGPLEPVELPTPEPHSNEILVRVRACGVCHTDLHTAEGEITGRLPVVPGHQIAGVVEKVGAGVTSFRVGDRVGIPWLHRTCGVCEFCRAGRENLCERAEFTGLQVNGGYAEFAVALAEYAVRIPARFGDAEAAPLLCAGIVGFRALRLSGAQAGQRLGFYGFGASAHLVLQVAVRQGCEVVIATRSAAHQWLAQELGATWVGRAEDVPAASLDAAIMFAPAGALVPRALCALRKAGTLVLAGIYMTPIPELQYEWLYHERVVRSVANATRDDARQFMELAGKIPLRTEVETFPLAEANCVLLMMKQSKLRGAGVLAID